MDRRAGPSTSRRRSGVTLLEILVVLTILGMIMGLTIGVLRNANRDLGVMAAANTITALLRAAGEHARAENLYARAGFRRLPRGRWALSLTTKT